MPRTPFIGARKRPNFVERRPVFDHRDVFRRHSPTAENAGECGRNYDIRIGTRGDPLFQSEKGKTQGTSQGTDFAPQKKFDRSAIDVLHPMNKTNAITAAVPQKLCLHVDRRVTRQHDIETLAGNEPFQIAGVLPLGGETPPRRIFAKSAAQWHSMYFKTLGVAPRRIEPPFRTLQPRGINVGDLMATARQFAAELHLKWMTREIVNQTAHGWISGLCAGGANRVCSTLSVVIGTAMSLRRYARMLK